MKTRFWVILFAVILAVSGLLGLWIMRPSQANFAEVYCDGTLLMTLDLRQDRVETVETEFGTNTLTVRDGKIAVTAADCPDGYCMQRGWCAGGPQIVCLPHRLVIKFTGTSEVDAIS